MWLNLYGRQAVQLKPKKGLKQPFLSLHLWNFGKNSSAFGDVENLVFLSRPFWFFFSKTYFFFAQTWIKTKNTKKVKYFFFFQPFGATNPGRKSYVTINESEAHLVQENIDYKKIATITTPKNLDVEYTKADMADPREITLEDPLDLNNRNVASASK